VFLLFVDAEFLEFRPSEMAAAVAMSVTPIKDIEDINKLLNFIHLEKVP
jgi:hypothetical protein